MTRIDWRGWVCGLALGLGLAVSMALAEGNLSREFVVSGRSVYVGPR